MEGDHVATTKSTTKTPNAYKKQRRKQKKLDGWQLLGTLFEALHNASRAYPPPDKQRTNDFLVSTDKRWRDLIFLCHPDKHNNSECSQEITRWLIENRPKK